MKRRIGRCNSSGLKGTLARIRHHAKQLRGCVNHLYSEVPSWGFTEWIEHESVHRFIRKDGAVVTIWPERENEVGYIGLTAYIGNKLRGDENILPIARWYVDGRNGLDEQSFSDVIKAVSFAYRT